MKPAAELVFPFVGAGVPSPFECVSWQIFFATPPAPKVAKTLARGWPNPLDGSLVGDRLVVAADALELTTPSTMKAIVAKVEARLLELHRTCPIAFAMLEPDLESDTPTFSKWHAASTKRIPELLTRFTHVMTEPTHEDVAIVEHLIAYARNARVNLPKDWMQWSAPGRRLLSAMLADRLDDARAVLAANAGRALFVSQVEKVVLALERDKTGKWATSQLKKWPMDVPWDRSVIDAWPQVRPRLAMRVLDLAAEIAASAAPIGMSELSVRTELLPALARVAIASKREDVLTTPAFRTALQTTFPSERNRFVADLSRNADIAGANRAAYRRLTRALSELGA